MSQCSGALIALALLGGARSLSAQRVQVINGNVFYQANGPAVALSTTGRAREAVLSPDGHQVVFVLGSSLSGAASAPDSSELWITIPRLGLSPRLLLRSRDAQQPESTLANFHDLVFTPDGSTLLFLSDAWVTSGAVHAISVHNGIQWYVCPGNSFRLRRDGLLEVSQHRYHAGGGSYEQKWLVSLAGRQIRALSAPVP